MANNEKQAELGNGFRFEPSTGGGMERQSEPRQEHALMTITSRKVARTLCNSAKMHHTDNIVHDKVSEDQNE